MAVERFSLEVSQHIEILQGQLEAEPQTDVVALNALAGQVGAQLPEEPRVLLLNAGQKPNLPTATIIGDGWLPTVRDENDIVVNLLARNRLDEPTLTASIARALIDRERAFADHRGKRIGLMTSLGGFALSGVGKLGFDSYPLQMVGLGVFVIGLGGVTYFAERNAASLPDTSESPPPIRIVDRNANE